MRVRFWGVRGSVPVADRLMLGYGGNTSCVEVTLSDGTELVLDAGTGIIGLGGARSSVDHVHLLLTHLHLDHIQGLLFFSPFHDPRARVDVWGPPDTTIGLRERLGRYLSAPLSPIEIRELAARVEFHDTVGGTWRIGSATLTAGLVSHRGPTLGYRIAEADATLCYLPDHEPALGTLLQGRASDWISGYALAERASLLIHDGQYTEEQYAERQGWGHSSITDALSFAHRTNADELVLFHHDPAHTDERLDALAGHAAERWQALGHRPRSVRLAAEGATIEIASRQATAD
jgi:phosphoribosyl 1,2-cyclic phosphodiesterase